MDSQHQEIPTHSLENMMVCPKAQERKPRPQPEQALKCPRCDSSNTKFCYYNNYSLSQPRYFCKSCRRYWTQGGTLRNVPVGGGCRKNKRSSSSSSSASSKRSQDQPLTTTLPSLSYDHQANDLSLAFARLQKYSCGQQQLGFSNEYDFSLLGNPDALANNNNSHGFLDHVMRNGYNNNNSHNLYYGNIGNGDNNMGGIENGGNGNNVGEMRLPYDQEQYTNATTTAVTVTTMKQELFGAGRENENRPILWGYPNWQMNNGDGNMGGEFDSAGRESWNGINASSWHGLLNSPLM